MYLLVIEIPGCGVTEDLPAVGRPPHQGPLEEGLGRPPHSHRGVEVVRGPEQLLHRVVLNILRLVSH